MSHWPGVYVIGLTGNIATGKTVVRKMLAELGAIPLDADALAHETMHPGGSAYAGVVDTFGPGILGDDKEIDRSRLSKIVFRDPEQLRILEGLVHPAVRTLIDARMHEAARPAIPTSWLSPAHTGGQPASRKVVVLEAIKLFESGLANYCDQVWATSCPVEAQLERLMRERGLTEAEARLRMDAQTAQLEKLARAQVVIDTAGTFTETRDQINKAWHKVAQAAGLRA